MNNRSLKKNAMLNALKSIVSFVFPLITYPYAAHVVGVELMGHVAYVTSFIYYFTLLAVFGVTAYAIREGAAIRDDHERFGAFASGLWCFNLCSVIISLVLLAVFTFAYPKLHSYIPVIVIQSLGIVFTALGADWVAQIYEDYGYITVRGIIISFVNMAVLFVFVKSPADYLVYAFLTVSTSVLSGIVNLIYIRRYFKIRPSFSRELLELIPKLRPFFVNEVSVAIYVGADSFLLGSIKNDYYVGIYSVSVKIYTIVKSVFIAIFSVTLSRLSGHVSKGERTQFDDIISGIVSTFVILGFPAMTGLILYARPIVVLVGGYEYERSMYSLMLLSIALIFAIFGGILTNCMNIPLGYEKVNSIATVIAAIENTVLNIPMIIMWNEIGAAITTILAEITVLIFSAVNLQRKNTDLKKYIRGKDLRDTFIGLMFIVTAYFIITGITDDLILQLVFGVVCSVGSYFGILLILKNDRMVEITRKIKNRIRHNTSK